MEFKKGKLYVQNAPYKKKITTPDSRQMLKMNTEEIKSVAEISLADGGSETSNLVLQKIVKTT